MKSKENDSVSQNATSAEMSIFLSNGQHLIENISWRPEQAVTILLVHGDVDSLRLSLERTTNQRNVVFVEISSKYASFLTFNYSVLLDSSLTAFRIKFLYSLAKK